MRKLFQSNTTMFSQDPTSEQLNPGVVETSPLNNDTGLSPQGPLNVSGLLRKIFSFHLFLAALLLGGTFTAALTNLHPAYSSSFPALRWIESDTLWHIKVGDLILKTHTWPTHDIYSFTAHGSPWIAYEWMGDVFMALAWRAGNMQGLAVLTMALASAIIFALFYLAYLGSRNVKSSFAACAVLLPLAAISWSLRPQLLGIIFLIVTLIVLRQFRQGHRKSIWILPLVFLLWANCHGTFVLGFGVLGVYWLSGLKEFQCGDIYGQRWTPRERRQLELIALLCLVASIITPYGTQLAAYPLEMAVSQPINIQNIQEWQPLALTAAYGKLFLALLLLFWIFMITKRKRIRMEDMALFLFATAETLIHARFMVLFVPVFAPLLAELISPWFPPYDKAKDQPLLNFALAVLIIGGVLKFFPSNTKMQKQLGKEVPINAVRFMDAHPGLSPTFNFSNWGGYLILEWHPAHRVFIDGRLDIYEHAGVLADYLSIMSLKPDTDELLRKYHIRSCLIPPRNPLAVLLASSPGWKEVYRDRVSAIFVRERVGENKENDAAGTPMEGGTAKHKMLTAGT